ncbi:hypothetical protein BJ508DRAFT_323734 [Ascobolus immersus RN42]|uniref:Uncharacterized protein n=1 Tax=Ascobolus immersus RN42 TaxID=1160509 RepID=A0A3N4IJW5_ASCIM|nr:hypothetical protein BJ508DRAFT_323734 [Ascobolus immersus RN42]
MPWDRQSRRQMLEKEWAEMEAATGRPRPERSKDVRSTSADLRRMREEVEQERTNQARLNEQPWISHESRLQRLREEMEQQRRSQTRPSEHSSSSYAHQSYSGWNEDSAYAGSGANDFSYRGRQALNMYPARREECRHDNRALQRSAQPNSNARWGYVETDYWVCQDCGSRV